jgi:hypothetical protein
MLQEMQKLQRSSVEVSNSFAASFPAQTLNEMTTALSCTIKDVREILARPIPLNDKVMCVGAEVRDRVVPLLEHFRRRAGEVLDVVRGHAEHAKENVANDSNGQRQNGHREQ